MNNTHRPDPDPPPAAPHRFAAASCIDALAAQQLTAAIGAAAIGSAALANGPAQTYGLLCARDGCDTSAIVADYAALRRGQTETGFPGAAAGDSPDHAAAGMRTRTGGALLAQASRLGRAGDPEGGAADTPRQRRLDDALIATLLRREREVARTWQRRLARGLHDLRNPVNLLSLTASTLTLTTCRPAASLIASKRRWPSSST